MFVEREIMNSVLMHMADGLISVNIGVIFMIISFIMIGFSIKKINQEVEVCYQSLKKECNTYKELEEVIKDIAWLGNYDYFRCSNDQFYDSRNRK